MEDQERSKAETFVRPDLIAASRFHGITVLGFVDGTVRRCTEA